MRPICIAPLAALMMSVATYSQVPVKHYFHSANLPTGLVAQHQAARNPEFQGYVQPIQIRVPKDATISVAQDTHFVPWQSKLLVGMMVGQTYRLKVGDIPHNPGAEVYPSVEIINRLHPPAGMETRFPVEIQITQRDLEHALAGRFVVRVVFLENPETAYPEAQDPNEQRTIMALADEDPLQLADQLGRPMAILRIGSRVPDPNGANDEFFFGSPPVEMIAPHEPLIYQESVAKRATRNPIRQIKQQKNAPQDEPSSMEQKPKQISVSKRETFPNTRKKPADDLSDDPILK